MNLRFLYVCLMLAGAIVASTAHDFEVAGIFYKVIGEAKNEVAVTYKGKSSYDYVNEYEDSVEIPSKVLYDNREYAVTAIASETFRGCSKLKMLSIPNTITDIGKNALVNTAWYNNYAEGVVYLGNCCLGYKGKKPVGDLELKDGTQIIVDYAFMECEDLKSVIIPCSMIKIGEAAFSGCKLRIVKSCCQTPPQCKNNTFDGNGTALLLIPRGTYINYAISDGWNEFSKLYEMD